MKVNPNRDLQAPSSITRQARKAVATNQAAVTADFAGTKQLSSKLAAIPESRPEAIARARQLISDSRYPNQETLLKIAHQLANGTILPD